MKLQASKFEELNCTRERLNADSQQGIEWAIKC